MPDVYITFDELPVATALTGSETLPVIQGGENRRTTVGSLPNVVAGWPFFDARYQGGYSAGSAFTTVPMNTVVTDTHSGWNSGSNVWTVPAGQTGIYQIFGKYRISDGGTGGVSTGIGIDTSNIDSPTFFWGVTNGNRHGMTNQRFVSLNAGDQVRLFSYIDGSARTIEAASLNIIRVR